VPGGGSSQTGKYGGTGLLDELSPIQAARKVLAYQSDFLL
jgi:hypothetical protein